LIPPPFLPSSELEQKIKKENNKRAEPILKNRSGGEPLSQSDYGMLFGFSGGFVFTELVPFPFLFFSGFLMLVTVGRYNSDDGTKKVGVCESHLVRYFDEYAVGDKSFFGAGAKEKSPVRFSGLQEPLVLSFPRSGKRSSISSNQTKFNIIFQMYFLLRPTTMYL
jgi:hypothetical protein